MGTLKIECYCSESQIGKLVKIISDHILNSDIDEDIYDLDECIDDIRLSVEFNSFLGKVEIVDLAILNSDWDILNEDTAVLASRMKPILKDFSSDYHEAIERAEQIKKEYVL